MTDIDPNYPPPPPSPAPDRKRPATAVIGALLVGAVAVALAIAVAVGSGERAAQPNSVRQQGASLERWVLRHGDEVGSVMQVVEGIASGIADTARNGEILETLSLCAEGADYLAGVSIAPATLDDDVPNEWTRMVNLWQQGFDACVDGDFDIASDYVARGTDAIRDLTARMRAL